MIISRPLAFGLVTAAVAMAAFLAMDNSEMMAGAGVFDAATVLAIFLLNMGALLFLLVRPQRSLRRLAPLMLIGNATLVWFRLALGLESLEPSAGGLNAVPPQQGWVPILFLAAFAFLAHRQALIFSLVFWLACVSLLLYHAIPAWDLWQQDLGLRTLLRQHLLAHPVYVLLLNLIPAPAAEVTGSPSPPAAEESARSASRDCSDQSSE